VIGSGGCMKLPAGGNVRVAGNSFCGMGLKQ
jgi:hypothetical protein